MKQSHPASLSSSPRPRAVGLGFALWVGVCMLWLPSAAQALSPKAKAGRAVMLRAECNRCHLVTDPRAAAPADAAHAAAPGDSLTPMEQARNCVACHVWILSSVGDLAAIAEAKKDFPDWDRYLKNIKHFKRLPDLGGLARKVRPSFIRRFLDGPFDLRPHLDEAMIPVRLSAKDKDAVVAYLSELAGEHLAPEALAEAVSAERVEAGRLAFGRSGCAVCHVAGNERPLPGVDAAFYQANPAASLAPNLRFVRDRVPRSVLVRFIQDPPAVDPGTAMPKLGIGAADAELIADYLLGARFDVPAAPADAVPVVTLLDRPVGWSEVHREVFGFVCVHCHMHPESNAGDGGPGNTGGLGFGGARLNLETWDGVRAGITRQGKRIDVLKPVTPGEPPLLVAALLRRHVEANRDRVIAFADHDRRAVPTPTDHPGMPLGLPPLSLSQVQLVATWVAQGAPGPE